jgi:hypothetical protein
LHDEVNAELEPLDPSASHVCFEAEYVFIDFFLKGLEFMNNIYMHVQVFDGISVEYKNVRALINLLHKAPQLPARVTYPEDVDCTIHEVGRLRLLAKAQTLATLSGQLL